jgi:hypothetical protein
MCQHNVRSFTLVTDHQPLTSIFSPNKGIPVSTAARLQRYALFLSGFNYQIEYKKTSLHSIQFQAPLCQFWHNSALISLKNVMQMPRAFLSLSRLPLAEPDRQDAIDGEDVFHMSQIEHLPVTSAVIQRETRDNVLARVHE